MKEIFVLENKKKVIIITLVVAVILACVSGFIAYDITLNNNKKENQQNGLSTVSNDDTTGSFVVGDYSLQYGTYSGYAVEYYWDDESEEMIESSRNELTLKLNSDNTYEFSGEIHEFTVVGTSIVVPDFNNIEMFEVIDNNKINLIIGSGVELTYRDEQ